MDIKKARRILEKIETTQEILAKYDDNIQPAFSHDICWACNFEETIVLMSEDEVKELKKLGWSY